jgi:hypothetical protein
MNFMEHLKDTHPVPVADKTVEIPGYSDKWIDERPALEFPWSCDCRNCGEYQDGACPLYGCMCKPGCRQDPPCAIERCVGYWPASDKFDKMAEDRLIMYLQRVSTPTANEIAPLFPKELLAQAYNKGLIQGVEDGYRYDLGESTEAFYWRINNTPWTLALVAKQNERNGIGSYEPFERWRLLMRYRRKVPATIAPVELMAKPGKANAATKAKIYRAKRKRELDALAPHGCLGASPCLCHSCINQETCGQCKKMNNACGHYHAHTMECPAYSKAEGEGWTCSDCLCPKCANKGQSCHTCEGPVYCTKHGGKMGGCPDFRAKDGEEQATVPVKAMKQLKPKKQPKLTRATVQILTLPAAELDVPDLVKVGDLVTSLHTRGFVCGIRKVTRVEKTDAGWQIYGDLWDDFRHPRRRLTSKDEPLVDWGVAGWRAEADKVVVQLENAVEKNHYDSVYGEKFADDRVIILTEEQVEQLCAIEEAENATAPTWFTHVWLKPAGSKGHKDAEGYLEDPRNKWPHLGYARFVDTSTAKYVPGHRAESYGDEPECEHCLCNACLHQKDCRLDNTLNPCSRCKAKGARHQKAVDCEGFRNS